MTAKVTGTDAWLGQFEKEIEQFEDKCANEMKQAARVLTEALFSRTPVWSGESVRNYVWGIGKAPAGGSKGQIGPVPPPRPTSMMQLGEEDNRPANEAAARADMDGVLRTYKKIDKPLVVTNTIAAKKWDLIDNGNAPFPGQGRNPGGVSKLAIQRARNTLRNFK